MSDRRPSKLHDPAKALEWWRAEGSKMAITELYEAVANPVAAVRRGVESGEIEGEVRWWTPHRGRIERHKGHLWEDQGPIVDGELSPVDRDGYWVLVIPTDGGSE